VDAFDALRTNGDEPRYAHMQTANIGIVGLGVMGQNLALNFADKGVRVAVHDGWSEQVQQFAASLGPSQQVATFESIAEFARALDRPRRIILLVKAGEVVDRTIAALAPLLAHGDVLIDAGNEFFENTERRASALAAQGLRFFGMGVSGGEAGARHGPSLMPGGDRAAYDELAPLLMRIAARGDGPAVTYIGPGGSGHFVKMVHNGIEYGDMQLLAETYDVLKSVGGCSNEQLAQTFERWNGGELESYLLGLTVEVLRKRESETGGFLLDVVRDAAGSKGTGKWTVGEALQHASPLPTIAAALDARVLSGHAEVRATCRNLAGPDESSADGALLEDARAALYAAKICTYAQGMALLRAASEQRGWQLDYAEIVRIWTAGCIIRARLLGDLKRAFVCAPQLPNLLMDEALQRALSARQAGLRRFVARAALSGVPVPAHASVLAYYDTLRRARLPQNLVQAQRDAFGAHTYERVDQPGTFHSEWLPPISEPDVEQQHETQAEERK
jgi:6-phosphogluconate dehydrogenase